MIAFLLGVLIVVQVIGYAGIVLGLLMLVTQAGQR